jgi:hypothetical protein
LITSVLYFLCKIQWYVSFSLSLMHSGDAPLLWC